MLTVSMKRMRLENWLCSCRSWQLSGIPCTHALCAILSEKKDSVDFVDRVYTVETYKKTYERPILGISYEALWGDSIYIPPLPPNFGRRPTRGRKASKRRLEDDEKQGINKKMKRQQKTVTCRRCGTKGHNAATCKTPMGEKEVEIGSSAGDPKPKRKCSDPKPKRKGSAKASAPTERTETTSRVIIDMTTKNQGTLPSLHVDIAPPNTVRSEPEPVIPTQESGITTVRWYAPPRPPVQGPSMHQQLGMSLRQPSQTILPRVQLRGPAPFSDGHFTMKSKDTVQSETFNRIYVDDVGNKFMELSSGSSGNGYNKGKKKVT
ncbi:hypothetical protein ACS0TY_004780 [Phlomoides rotata]